MADFLSSSLKQYSSSFEILLKLYLKPAIFKRNPVFIHAARLCINSCDLNASQNILAWALEPKKHIKYRERQAAIRQAKEASVDETELPKEIKANWLIEINSKKNRKH